MPRFAVSTSLESAESAESPAAPGGWRRLHVAVGQEMFGRPAGPWGTLFLPLPLGTLIVGGLLLFGLPHDQAWHWIGTRLGEAAFLLGAPFWLATVAQAIGMGLSQRLWQTREGEYHLDYSARAWHFYLASVICFLPIALLQICPPFLDWYLGWSARAQAMLGALGSGHAGYDPDPANMLVAGVFPLIVWQVRRLLRAVPCGRLLGLQRELARLRGSVGWDSQAWAALVADAFDRWLFELQPPGWNPDTPEAEPESGRARKPHRLYLALRGEVVASYAQTPPDLPRANRALATYRQGL